MEETAYVLRICGLGSKSHYFIDQKSQKNARNSCCTLSKKSTFPMGAGHFSKFRKDIFLNPQFFELQSEIWTSFLVDLLPQFSLTEILVIFCSRKFHNSCPFSAKKSTFHSLVTPLASTYFDKFHPHGGKNFGEFLTRLTKRRIFCKKRGFKYCPNR